MLVQYKKELLGDLPKKNLTDWFNNIHNTQARDVELDSETDDSYILSMEGITEMRVKSTKGFKKIINRKYMKRDTFGIKTKLNEAAAKGFAKLTYASVDLDKISKAFKGYKGKTEDDLAKYLLDNGFTLSDSVDVLGNIAQFVVRSEGDSFAEPKPFVTKLKKLFKTPDNFEIIYNLYAKSKESSLLTDEILDFFEDQNNQDELEWAVEYYIDRKSFDDTRKSFSLRTEFDEKRQFEYYPDIKIKKVKYRDLKVGDYISDGLNTCSEVSKILELNPGKQGWTIEIIESVNKMSNPGEVITEDNITEHADEFAKITNYNEKI